MKILLAGILFSISAQAFSQIVVKGTVCDYNGHVPVSPQIHLGKPLENASQSKTYLCKKDGSFEFVIPNAGVFELRISAVSHEEASVPIIAENGSKEIELNVTLKADDYDSSPDRVRIIGDWNTFAFSGNDTLTPSIGANGKKFFTYSRIATGDTMSYQLLGVASAHSVNGSQADYYTYDGGGDYRCVLRTKKGETVSISYDPAAMPLSNNNSSNNTLPHINFKNSPLLQKIVVFNSTVQEMEEATRIYPKNGGPVSISQEKYSDVVQYIKNTMEGDRKAGNTNALQFEAVTLADSYNPRIQFSKEDAAMVLNTVPANSPMWAFDPRAAMSMIDLSDSAFGQKYLVALEETNPEPVVRAQAYAGDLENAYEAKRTKDVRRLFDLLKKNYSDVDGIKYELVRCNPDAVVQVGRRVPSFDLALLDGSGNVSDKSMLGKYYMIDFWATWCGPCVGEMPSLHQAYQKFKGKKGFEILSLSMDAAEANIAPFRAKKWKMPWLHAFIPGVFNADVAKTFEASSIPKPILVDPQGNIVAMENDLRGEDLEKTLAKYLGEPN